MVLDSSGLQLTLTCGTVLHFSINKSNNLLFILTQASLDKRRTLPNSNLNLKISTTSSGIYNSGVEIHNNLIGHSIFKRDNINLGPSQQELLKWHCRWSHVNLDQVRMILAKPHQPKGSFDCGEIERQMVVPSISNTSTYKQWWCTACLFVKPKENTPKSSLKVDIPELEGVLTNKDTQPSDKVSCDQYMSPIKGCLIHTRGKESSMKQLWCGAIFVDHATNFIFNNHQVNLIAASSVASKHKCESKFDEFGVQIK